MRTVRKIVRSLFVIVSFAACNSPGTEVVPNTWTKDYQQLEIHASVNQAEVPLNIQEGFVFDLSGTTVSCNLTDQLFYYMSGFIRNVQGSGNYEVLEGELALLSENSGCDLVGTFNGTGLKYGNQFEIDAIVKVVYGTGRFEADGGELGMKIKGKQLNDHPEHMEYQLDITGLLEKKVYQVK